MPAGKVLESPWGEIVGERATDIMMIDWSRVNELRDDVGPEDFEEITALFLEEVEERLDELEAGTSDNLPETFHFLKGSAANLGFETLRSLCQTAEKEAGADAISDVLRAYKESKDAFLQGV